MIDAARDAAESARSAGVSISPVTSLAGVDELRGLMEEIWGPSVVPPRNVLRAMSFADTGLLLARRDGRAVGFSIGLVGFNDGLHFHSHQVGVVADVRSSGVGYAIKMAQRIECLSHGITEMRWTFDPLLRSNATFNLLRLGARVIGFIPDAYGRRDDNFNAGDVTDRVKVSWTLDTEPGREPITDVAGRELVEVPENYQSLKRTDPDEATRQRSRVGDALGRAVADGRGVVGFSGRAYVLG